MRAGAYWRVSPKFWPDTARWSEDARMFALYLLTCEHRTTEGLFVLRLPYIHADLNWSPERLAGPLEELTGRGFIEHDPERAVFLIVHALEYQAPGNPNAYKSALRKLDMVPSDSPLTSRFKELCHGLCQPLYQRLPHGFGQPMCHPPALPPPPTHLLVSSRVTETESEVVHRPKSNPVTAIKDAKRRGAL